MDKVELLDVLISGAIAALALNVSSYVLKNFFPQFNSANIILNVLLIIILLVFRDHVRRTDINYARIRNRSNP